MKILKDLVLRILVIIILLYCFVIWLPVLNVGSLIIRGYSAISYKEVWEEFVVFWKNMENK